ncbi:MAG: hydrogenase maturation nickel metallochaperone HypA [Nostocoides sp.]
MHELSLLQSVVTAVEAGVDETQRDRVAEVGLVVGSLSGAVPEVLQTCWPLAVSGTPLAGARLNIEQVQAAIWCPGCQSEQEVDEFYALACPHCGTPSGDLVRGREFQVRYADIEDGRHE